MSLRRRWLGIAERQCARRANALHRLLSRLCPCLFAGMAELVDALDSKSSFPRKWGFDSLYPHHFSHIWDRLNRGPLLGLDVCCPGDRSHLRES